MNVAVVSTWAPFLRGGAELLADRLVEEVRIAGHRATLVRVPLRMQRLEDVEDAVAIARLQRLDVDRMIGLKFPGYLVPHPSKVLWVLHQFRQVHDLWGHPHGGIPGDPAWDRLRQLVRRADTECFREAQRIYCNSAVTAERMLHATGDSARVLHPPLHHVPAPAGPPGDVFVALGRISDGKRQTMAVEAMASAPPGARLVVAGPPDAPDALARVEAAAEAAGVADRVEVVARFVSDDEKEELLRRARAVLVLPIDEDSCSYVALEAAAAGRPVITVADAGGVLQLVRDGTTGLVAAADPAEVGRAIGRLHADPALAATLGSAAAVAAAAYTPTWAEVTAELLR